MWLLTGVVSIVKLFSVRRHTRSRTDRKVSTCSARQRLTSHGRRRPARRIRFAHEIVGVSPQTLFRQVTSSASDILCLKQSEGSIRPLARADFFAAAADHSTPAERLAGLSFRDIELVVNGGVVQVASAKAWDRLSPSMRQGLVPIEVDGCVRWVRQPLGKLFARTEAALGCDFTTMGRKVRHVSSAWI